VAHEESPAPDELAQPVIVEAPSQVVALTLEQRHPYIRFLRHGEDDLTALLVAPVGFGATMEATLKQFCGCFQPDTQTATITVLENGGMVFSGDPKKAPWLGAPSTKPIEDLLAVRGPEAAIEEVLSFTDLFFNGGPQIEIQAEIFEITNSDDYMRGVQPNGQLITVDGAGGAGEGTVFQGLGGGFGASGIGDYTSSGPGGIFSLAFSESDLQVQAFLQFLRSLEGVDIVSYPRIVTRNGVPAKIESSEEIPYLSASNISSATGITALTVKDKKAGVNLWVQPFQIGGDMIHLLVEVNASRIGRTYEVGTDTTGKPLAIPSLNTRSATTSVVVRSGHKVVIGGLKLREERIKTSKIPLLGDIPLLGWLFSSEEKVEAETEVMFVLTPRVKTRSASISPFSDEIFDPFADDVVD